MLTLYLFDQTTMIIDICTLNTQIKSNFEGSQFWLFSIEYLIRNSEIMLETIGFQENIVHCIVNISF